MVLAEAIVGGVPVSSSLSLSSPVIKKVQVLLFDYDGRNAKRTGQVNQNDKINIIWLCYK